MTVDRIEKARSGDERAFGELMEPFRPELQLHCYRILGALHDAEDAVQDTLVAAWQSLGGFEGRSSIRTWLYRIATNRCLNRLRAETRRPKTATTGMREADLPEPTRFGEVLWLEPYPDVLLDGVPSAAPGPDAAYEIRESVSLAFITALQLLPPRQRAALILRDVLGYRAAEAAQILDTSVESVTSSLKRARATLRQGAPHGHDRAQPVKPAVDAALVEQFTQAFESGDLDGLIRLLTEDVWFAMPPLPFEWQGQEKARQFLAAMWAAPAGRRLVPTRANGQPAFVLYIHDPRSDVMRAVGVLVLTLNGDRIAAITRFDNSVLGYFGLPRIRR